MLVYVLVLDEVFDLGLSSLLDTFSTAGELAGRVAEWDGPPFRVRMVSVRARVRTKQGLSVPVVSAQGLRKPDVVIVPAIAEKMPEQLLRVLGRSDVADACEVLRKWAHRGSQTCAACGGTFVLAQSGLLDGGRATTSWWLAPMFRERFPNVTLEETNMVLASGASVTAGAALAHLDLALWLVRRRSPALAELVARYLMLESRTSTAVYAIPDHLAHSDALVSDFETWARKHLDVPFSLSEAARAVGTSPRTLSRRTQTTLGKSPLVYVQELRVERACHLLRTTEDSVESIATQVGYGDGVTLRTLLRKKTGRGVKELRKGWG